MEAKNNEKRHGQDYRRSDYTSYGSGGGNRGNRNFDDRQGSSRHYRGGYGGRNDRRDDDGGYVSRNYRHRGDGGGGRRDDRNYDRKRSRSSERDGGRGSGSNRGEGSPERKKGSSSGYNYSNSGSDYKSNSSRHGSQDSKKSFNACDTKSSNPPASKGKEADSTDDIDEEDLRPISLNITCPAATTLVQQIEKRKLLFSKKDAPVSTTATSSSVWQKTTFSDDSDGKVSAKFKRLMGMKDGAADSDKTNTDKKDRPLPATQSKEFFNKLEHEYEVARTITHTQRGVGLGFGSGGLPPRPTWK